MSPEGSLVIAIDGPAGSGKTTVAAELARRLGVPHIDTGAMYRAATLAVIRAGVSTDAADAVEEVIRKISVKVKGKDAWLGDEDVSKEIRRQHVTALVSAVSSIPGVRRILVEIQRRLAEGGVVMEGRDIGSVVLPDADLKVFLTASVAERAERRAGETGEGLTHVLADIERRDTHDSNREASPMKIPEGAIVIDSSGREVADVVTEIQGHLEGDHP